MNKITKINENPIILFERHETEQPTADTRTLNFDVWIEEQAATTWFIVSEKKTGYPVEFIVYLITKTPTPETLSKIQNRLLRCQIVDTFTMAVKALKDLPEFGFIDIVKELPSSIESPTF